MKYEGVCIAVKDVERSKRFYQELFELEVFQDYGINVMELYFEEDNFDDFLVKLEGRDDINYIGDGVKEAGWGQRSIRFYDLDGHIIEVGENMKMVVKRFLDSGMSMEETSKRMDVSIADLETLLRS